MTISGAGATVIKYGLPASALLIPQELFEQFNPVMAVALAVGLFAGVLWRAGDAKGKGETWNEIRDDLLVSALIGLANLVIAAIVVQTLKVPPLYAIGVAMVVAGKGPDAMAWFERRFMGPRKPH